MEKTTKMEEVVEEKMMERGGREATRREGKGECYFYFIFLIQILALLFG